MVDSDYFSSESEESHSPATQIQDEGDDDLSPEKNPVADSNLHPNPTTAKKNLKFKGNSNNVKDDFLATAQLNFLILQRLQIELHAEYVLNNALPTDTKDRMLDFARHVVNTKTIPAYISVAKGDAVAKAQVITFATEYLWMFDSPQLHLDFTTTKQHNGAPLKKC